MPASAHAELLNAGRTRVDNNCDRSTNLGTPVPPLTTEIAPLWRFRAAAMKRGVALAWVILAIFAAQAVREQSFDQIGFAIGAVALALVLVSSSLIDWYRVMPTVRGPWATFAWTMSITICLVVVGTQPGMETLAPPMFFGVVALSGLVLDRFKHIMVTILAVAGLAFLAASSSNEFNLAALIVQDFSVVVVATATALDGIRVRAGIHSKRPSAWPTCSDNGPTSSGSMRSPPPLPEPSRSPRCSPSWSDGSATTSTPASEW